MLSGGDRLYNYRNPPSTVDKAKAEVNEEPLSHLEKYEVKIYCYDFDKAMGLRGYRESKKFAVYYLFKKQKSCVFHGFRSMKLE